jgi:hypothetical protein
MDETTMIAYVSASAALLRLPMDEARARRVADHLQRTAAMARLLEQAGLAFSDEPAEIYRLERPAERDRPEW